MILFVLLFLIVISAFKSDSSTIMRLRKSKSSVASLDGIAKFPVPFIVSIQSNSPKEHKHLCAGTIIDKNIVLTAAHCFHEFNKPERLRVIAGSNKINTTNGIRHQVLKIIRHEHFVPLTGPDIALLKVKPNFRFDNKTIAKINFNGSKSVDEMHGYLAGWGGSKKDMLLELVSFTTIDTMTCWDRGFRYVKDTEICAISYKGRGACDGDSGGPLLNTDFNLQIGILSYGRTPCIQGAIYAFTRLSSLKDWIYKNMKKFR